MNIPPENSYALLEHLKIEEGFRSFPYLCTAKKMTIGYGRNIEDVGVSEEEAEILLLNDAVKASKQLEDSKWINDSQLNTPRKMALIAMIFQLGLGGVKKFKKMIAAINQGDWEEAAAQAMDSRWAKQTPRRAVFISTVLRSGVWPQDHKE